MASLLFCPQKLSGNYVLHDLTVEAVKFYSPFTYTKPNSRNLNLVVTKMDYFFVLFCFVSFFFFFFVLLFQMILFKLKSGVIERLTTYMKKLLDSDWLRALQFKCNTSAKSVTPVQITHYNSES